MGSHFTHSVPGTGSRSDMTLSGIVLTEDEWMIHDTSIIHHLPVEKLVYCVIRSFSHSGQVRCTVIGCSSAVAQCKVLAPISRIRGDRPTLEISSGWFLFLSPPVTLLSFLFEMCAWWCVYELRMNPITLCFGLFENVSRDVTEWRLSSSKWLAGDALGKLCSGTSSSFECYEWFSFCYHVRNEL